MKLSLWGPTLIVLISHAVSPTFAAFPVPKPPPAPRPEPVAPEPEPEPRPVGGTSGGDGSLPPGSSPAQGAADDEWAAEEALDLISDSIQNAIPDNSGDSTITTGPIPTNAVADPNARACIAASSVYSDCAVHSSNFYSLGLSYQASCLCYWTSSGMVGWAPSSFAGLMSRCNSYAETSGTGFQTGLADAASLCTSVGDVRMSQKVAGASLSSYYASQFARQTATPTNPYATGTATSSSPSLRTLSWKNWLWVFVGIQVVRLLI
ncbi:MAG: hypothetical protein Q9190_002425 [Brigantiaea leucoxantha]